MKALNTNNFEFSETYLYFWDKVERANYFLEWATKNTLPLSSREVEYMLTSYRDDGGYWDMFAHLLGKYGLCPKSAMPETYHSGDSEELNRVIHERLDAYLMWIQKGKATSPFQKTKVKQRVLYQIYEILVKFLGAPPNKFTWYFKTDEEESPLGLSITATPFEFTTKTLFGTGKLNIKDYVLLGNFPVPKCPMNKRYAFRLTSNIVGAPDAQFLNLPIDQLVKYTVKSLMGGAAVWVACDVGKDFNFYRNALNPKLFTDNLLFGNPCYTLDKGERVMLHGAGPSHAMVFTGVNMDKNVPLSFEVENSWGYVKGGEEEDGDDGFLTMSKDWFEKHVYEVVIHSKVLKKAHAKLLLEPITVLEPWDSMSLKVGPHRPV
jgi:bleomycin hydrolase